MRIAERRGNVSAADESRCRQSMTPEPLTDSDFESLGNVLNRFAGKDAMNLWFRVLLAGWLAGPVAGLCGAEVGLIQIKGVIGPATAGYISRGIDLAGARGYACLILQLDTPGGSLESTKDIVQKFYVSTVPTVVYVAPAGAWAGSAGCFITMAADIAAMAPSTSIGAAHPVSLGVGGAEKTDDVMKQKKW